MRWLKILLVVFVCGIIVVKTNAYLMDKIVPGSGDIGITKSMEPVTILLGDPNPRNWGPNNPKFTGTAPKLTVPKAYLQNTHEWQGGLMSSATMYFSYPSMEPSSFKPPRDMHAAWNPNDSLSFWLRPRTIFEKEDVLLKNGKWVDVTEEWIKIKEDKNFAYFKLKTVVDGRDKYDQRMRLVPLEKLMKNEKWYIECSSNAILCNIRNSFYDNKINIYELSIPRSNLSDWKEYENEARHLISTFVVK